METKQIARIAKVSKNTVYNVKKGKTELYKPETVNRILSLLDFHSKFLTDVFLQPAFLEMCDTAISKSRNPQVREFAALCKHASLSLKISDSEKESDSQKLKSK